MDNAAAVHLVATALLEAASLAPSSHNTQPWLFRVNEGSIDLLADRTRALPANDPDDRELTISCGCALMNLRLAAESRSLPFEVKLLPDAADPDWLARVDFNGRPHPSPSNGGLARHIPARRTYRKRFAPTPVDPAATEALVDAARSEGAWLRPLADDWPRQEAAALVAEGDAAQWADPSWRRELAAWMHPRRRGDGLTVPGLALPFAQLVVRSFDMGNGVGAKDRELAEASPLLAVLGTGGDGPRDWLAAGQALQRLLLTAVEHGLQASYLNQPAQVPALRLKLKQLTGDGFPQLLLRLGHPLEEIPAAPRRPLEDVIDR
jgi:nitroreductase